MGPVDVLGRHALCCQRSGGRHHRHAALNTIISRALTTAGIPSRLEPTGLLRTDGKRPDGMSLAPWSSGKLLVWDATCSDTFAPSHRSQATHAPGEVAARTDERKEAKYISLPAGHQFVPVAVETMGANTALFKGAWEENEGPNWRGKVGRLPASKTVSSSAEGECHLHHERPFGGCT